MCDNSLKMMLRSGTLSATLLDTMARFCACVACSDASFFDILKISRCELGHSVDQESRDTYTHFTKIPYSQIRYAYVGDVAG